MERKCRNEDQTEAGNYSAAHAAADALYGWSPTSLSKQERSRRLDALELQDARQLATASAEGMTGGEPVQLSEVLRPAGARKYRRWRSPTTWCTGPGNPPRRAHPTGR
jgi:hypothetical protein